MNPIVAIIFPPIAYFVIGQSKKAIILIGLAFLTGICTFGILSFILFAGNYDAYLVCKALQNGEAVDENEYRFGLWYSICKLFHKDAILKEG